MLLVLVGHLLVMDQYGVHRDELYFVACGQHLAAGYVDHPPLVPAIARAACALGHCDVVGLRVAPLIARIATVVLTILLVRALRGGEFAQAGAGLAVVLAPAYLRMGKILCIPVFEPVFWMAGALLLVALARRGSRWHWLLLGAVVGLGTLNKHTMLVWALGVAIGCFVVPQLRLQLRTAGPWLAVLVAAGIVAPNVIWQLNNQFATIQFLGAIRTGMLAQIPRAFFVLGQFLYMHPFSALLWIPGLWFCFAPIEGDRVPRVFGIIFLLGATVFLLTRGKPYYLAPAFPPLFAMGALVWERRLVGRWSRVVFLTAQISTGVAMAILTLPVLSLPRMDSAVGMLLGRIVPPMALTHDLHDEYGWQEQVATIAGVWGGLSPDEQRRTEIVTANYGEAAAIGYLGSRFGLPRASSGHMTYFLWGPANRDADSILAVGLPPEWLSRRCSYVEERAIADDPLAAPTERHVPIVLCRGLLTGRLQETWSELKQYDNAPLRQLPR